MRLIPILVLFLLTEPVVRAQENAPTNDPRWQRAQKAYLESDLETANTLLVELVEAHPGDLDLAVRCWETILQAEGAWGTENPWIRLASERLLSLERLGGLSANTSTTRTAFDTVVEHGLRDGRNFDVVELLDRMRQDNPHDLFWRLRQARGYGRMDLVRAREFHRELERDQDSIHPHGRTRERWREFESGLKAQAGSLPKPIVPLPEGSPLMLMEPDDPDGRWRNLADRSPADIPEEINRLAGLAFGLDQVVPWQDMSGLIDPPRALDLHLLSKPGPELAALRKAQDGSFALEDLPSSPTQDQVLALARRYPWAEGAQHLLLELGNGYLWAGRAESALRCYQDLLNHVEKPTLRDAALVGSWTALAQVGGHAEINAALGNLDPARRFSWMGGESTANEIRNRLLATGRELQSPAAPSLRTLRQHKIHLPPVSPWPTDSRSSSTSIDLQVDDDLLLVSGRNILLAYDTKSPDKPRWAQLQRHPAEENNRTDFHPGYFRPLIGRDLIYTRWGLTSFPSVLAAFDRHEGKPLWSSGSMEPPVSGAQKVSYRYSVPTGDPVAADGCLYYLQWDSIHDINDRRGRSLSLVCFDPVRQQQVWKGKIADAGRTTDAVANFERARAQFALYGNSVTVHRGGVYCNSNAGLISRLDARDGRVDWIHYYRRTEGEPDRSNLGSAPLVAGDKIICMPRDSRRVFALDRETGRLVWDNPLASPVEMLGIFEENLILRGRGVLASLDVSTGEAKWFHPTSDDCSGRSYLVGSSIYLGDNEGLRRINPGNGHLEETRAWNLGGERPLGFVIDQDQLFVVTDRPREEARERIGEALAPDAPAEAPPLALPLRQTWSIARADALVALPPEGSPLAGLTFVLSGGILECLEASPRGGILWQRFISTHKTSIAFSGGKLLLIENARRAGSDSRVFAFDGASGEVLWDSPRPSELGNTLQFGDSLLFHDGRGRLVAFDLETGSRTWDRNLGGSHLLLPSWRNNQLHVFSSSFHRGTFHDILDPTSGKTLTRHQVRMENHGDDAIHGHPVEDGFLEVRFQPGEARFVRLTALSEINGRGWASAAELHLLDAKGTKLPRSDWNVEALHETQSNRNPVPQKLIDGDRGSWWHTPWLNGIPPHPHAITIDLGSKQTISGLQYLPAVIVNNNGMIRDYSLSLSTDGQDWGKPVARGVMVNRTHVDRAHFAGESVWFEARNTLKNQHAVFRYELNGKPAAAVAENARLEAVKGSWALVSAREDDRHTLHAVNTNDPANRFELTPKIPHHRAGYIVIEGDRLFMADQELAVVDLAAKKFLLAPDHEQVKNRKNGAVVRIGSDRLLKILHKGTNPPEVIEINLTSGDIQVSKLEGALDSFQSGNFQSQPLQRFPRFGPVLLYYDRSTLSAWISEE